MKKWIMMVSLIAVAVIAGCSSSEAKEETSSKEKADYTIGITQIVEHPSLDAAQEGFKDAFKEAELNVDFDVQLAQGDAKNNQTIADNFVGNKVDLIFANSTGSAQSALNATKDIPIVFTSVTDPVGSNLVDTMEAPGGNVTGTTDTHPDAIPNTISFMTDKMNVQTVGMLYNPSEQNSSSQIERVKDIAGDKVEIKTATVTTSAEVKQAAESLTGKVDALYIVTDNTVVSALESVLLVGQQEDTPVLVGELDSVERGGFAAYGFDYYDIGFEAGEKAIQILEEGKNPGEIQVSYPQNLKLEINQNAAKEMGVEIKDAWKEEAEIIGE